jgi:hypothetical protein
MPEYSDEIKQEIRAQLKGWMYTLIATHITALISGGGIGFMLGRFY